MDHIKPILELRNIRKSFPGVIALDDVSFDLYPGEIHALLGENGAGKSTLIKILGGVYSHDAGEIFIDGKPINIDSPLTATKYGIAIIHQELNLIPGLSIADNILLGQHPKKKLWFIDNKRLYDKSLETLQELGLTLSPKARVGNLATASGQLVLISQALARKPRFLVMDEPTSALGDTDIDYLFDVIKHLASQEVGIIYISHKLDEIFKLSDRVTVLRDGKKVADRKTAETHREELVNLMVGRQLTEMYPKRSVNIGDALFEVQDFFAPGVKYPVSFKAHKGEILGLFGLLGAGRTRLANSLYGVIPGKGRIIIDGREERIASPADASAVGLGLMPIERKKEGLVMPASIENNILLSTYPKYAQSSFMQYGNMAKSAETWIDVLRIRSTGRNQIVRDLSGGNQQKVVLGRLLEASTKVLILNSPTRGIDVGAKVEIYNLMGELCTQGKCIIFLTSELPELLGLSDRILVMANGRITAEFSRAEATQEKIMHAAIGEDTVEIKAATKAL